MASTDQTEKDVIYTMDRYTDEIAMLERQYGKKSALLMEIGRRGREIAALRKRYGDGATCEPANCPTPGACACLAAEKSEKLEIVK